MEGVEAATNIILGDELPSDLLGIVRQAKGEDDSIEILLNARTVAGFPQDTKIVAYRVHSAVGIPPWKPVTNSGAHVPAHLDRRKCHRRLRRPAKRCESDALSPPLYSP